MKSALIIWGGWEGHEPETLAGRIAEGLESKGYQAIVTCSFSVLLNDDLKRHAVIIPIWSCGIKGEHYLAPLLEAVHGGVGLVTFHGGINWFEEEKYYEMIGGLYLSDTKPERYRISIADRQHPIMSGLEDFEIFSEKYCLMTNPQNHILASADFSDTSMPIAWTKHFGQGKVFYSALAHSAGEFFKTPCLEMILNAIDWAAS